MKMNNHPANGPLTVERIARVRDELQRTMFYASGGVMDHIVVDAIKALEELLVRRGVEPEVLPCPVFLEPGLRFGKGVKTQLLFDALKRRAEYYAELDAMTPKQRAEHDAGIDEFKKMLGGNSSDAPVAHTFDEWLSQQADSIDVDCGCVSTEAFMHWMRKAYDGGRSSIIPDGYVMVPIEPTEDMIVEGFESEPDEDFSDSDVWEEYQAMSGCKQAVHRAKLCWAAMLSAAPTAPEQENI